MTGPRAEESSSPIELWIRAIPALAVLHLALFLALELRPGRAGVVLWHVGPALLKVLAAGLLFMALATSVRHRHVWNRWRLAGYLGLIALVTSMLFMYRTYPSSHDAAPSEVQFRLPLDGPVRVAWGGPRREVNYHVSSPSERWAYDLLITRDGSSYERDGSRLEDYHAYDQPVLAPAAGRVHSAVDGEPDLPIGTRWRNTSAAGNHVMLEVAPGGYLFIAHLRPGSVTVAPGDRVAQGQEIGRVGNSGNSSEPHVHIHLQDGPHPRLAEGIPLYFHEYRHEQRGVARGMPEGGRSNRRWTGDVVAQIQD